MRRSREPLPTTGFWSRQPVILGLRVLVIAVVLGAWQLMSGPVLPRYAVSQPTAVAVDLANLLTSSSGWADIRTTAFEIGMGFVLGLLLGTVMALVLGALVTVGRVLEPLVAAVNGIPKIALAPVFLLFFGIGDWSKVAIAVTSVSFVIFYNLYLGIRLIRPELVDMIRIMGGRKRDVLIYVTLPSLVAPFVAGMKAGGPLAIVGVVAGEFMASFNGVGHLLFVDSNNLDAAGVFASLVVLVIMALVINSILNLVDGFVLRRLGMQPRT